MRSGRSWPPAPGELSKRPTRPGGTYDSPGQGSACGRGRLPAEGAAHGGEGPAGCGLLALDRHGAEVDAPHTRHVEQFLGEPDGRVDARYGRVGRVEDPGEEPRR